MPTPLANRFVHIYMEPDLEDWISWGLGAGIRTELLAYARYRPAVLNGFDPARTEKAFSGRGWGVGGGGGGGTLPGPAPPKLSFADVGFLRPIGL
jgi:hypothetical protein